MSPLFNIFTPQFSYWSKVLVYIIVFVPFSFFSAFGEDKPAEIDSLLTLAAKEPNDSTRLMYYWDLSYYYQPVDTIQMWYYYDTAVALAIQLNNMNALAGVNIDMGNRYMYEGFYSKAEEYYRKAIAISAKENNVQSMLTSWLNIAGLYSNRGDYQRQMHIVDSCLRIGEKLHYENIIVGCFQLKGEDFWRKGQMDSASFYTVETARMAENAELTHKVTEAYNSLGQMYFELQDYDKAVKYLKLALTTSYYIVGSEYLFLGKTYVALGNDSLAEVYFDSALTASKKHVYYDLQASVLNSLGNLNVHSYKNYNEGIKNYLAALKIEKEFGERGASGETYLNLAEVYLLKKNPDSALIYATNAIRLAEENDEKENRMIGYLRLSETLKLQGNFDQALDYYEKYHLLADSLLNEKKLKNITEIQVKYEAAKKDLKIQKNREKLRVMETEKRELIGEMILGVVLLVLIFGALFAHLRVRATKSEQRLQQQFSQDVITSQEQERKRISRDLHDSIGQNLLLILRDEAVNKKEALNTLVGETLEDVRSISRDLHPVQLERLGITKAVEQMVDKCDQSGDIVFSDEIDNIDGLFEPNDEINLYRIIQECLNNVMKHSRAKAARLDIKVSGSHLKIMVTDNGRGSKNMESAEFTNSLGLVTLRERTKYLSGIFRIKSSAEAGTKLTFDIPIKSNERS